MMGPLPHRVFLTVLVGLMMVGCAMPPPEKPIILRRPLSDRRAVRTPATRRPPAASPAVTQTAPSPAAPDATLTPDQKTALFRQFDEYLAKPAPR
ncbi:MAG: hypothetical protein ACRYG8_16640 [Janthinobacterium lividum]